MGISRGCGHDYHYDYRMGDGDVGRDILLLWL